MLRWKTSAKNEGVNSELADFVQCGLFFNDKAEKRRLYLHQYNALKEAAINRKNIVVTTGTGSGKTECFLLPIFCRSHIRVAHMGQNESTTSHARHDSLSAECIGGGSNDPTS